ncbi:MAG: prepilin-type N-terminal cleavage/methylation domain-containing protein, partial [Longimicrobiales bacterium]
FTLIELLIVIVIIGILAMIATSVFWNVKDRGLQASLQADLKTAATQQELYFAANDSYAPTRADLTELATSPGVLLTITYGAADGWAGITTHAGLASAACALMMNNAPPGSAPPAVTPGVIECTGL